MHSTLLFSSVLSRARRGRNLKRAGKRMGVCKGFCGYVRETLWEEEPGGERQASVGRVTRENIGHLVASKPTAHVMSIC